MPLPLKSLQQKECMRMQLAMALEVLGGKGQKLMHAHQDAFLCSKPISPANTPEG